MRSMFQYQLMLVHSCWFSERWDVCEIGLFYFSFFLFVIQVECLERKNFSLNFRSHFPHSHNDTIEIRIAARERIIVSQPASEHERERERMLIGKHVDFSMCSLSTFCLFSQMPYTTRLECNDKNGCVYNNISSTNQHHTIFILFISLSTMMPLLLLEIYSLHVCIFSHLPVLNVIRNAQKCS